MSNRFVVPLDWRLHASQTTTLTGVFSGFHLTSLGVPSHKPLVYLPTRHTQKADVPRHVLVLPDFEECLLSRAVHGVCLFIGIDTIRPWHSVPRPLPTRLFHPKFPIVAHPRSRARIPRRDTHHYGCGHRHVTVVRHLDLCCIPYPASISRKSGTRRRTSPRADATSQRQLAQEQVEPPLPYNYYFRRLNFDLVAN